MSAEPLARCRGAARTYGRGASATVALRPVDCEVAPGARIAIVGESGSGKSTLLHLLAGRLVREHDGRGVGQRDREPRAGELATREPGRENGRARGQAAPLQDVVAQGRRSAPPGQPMG